MKRFVFAALATCLLLAPALQVAAQYGDDTAPKIGFKIGLYSPTGEKLSDEKSIWRCLGIEYSLSMDELDRPTLVASAIMTGTETGLIEASMIGIQAEKRWYMNPTQKNSLYYGAGLGFYSLKAKTREFPWEDSTDRNGGKIGITAAAGYQVSEAAFGEIRYNYSGKLANGLDYSGISINIGARMEF